MVEALLGAGGMAAVYRVRHQRLGSVFALKVLTKPDADVRKRMLLEGQIQATLRHTNIVSVVDVLDIGDTIALQMDFIAGPPLDSLLKTYKPSLDEALQIFGGVLSGIAAAHEAGLVHRDLKPANVMLHIADEGLIPKVADFGIAKAAPAAGSVDLTRPGSAMGTPAYMSPEQIHDTGDVDPRADIYALGVLLYELTVGQRAFPGKKMLDVLNAVNGNVFVDPHELRPELPQSVVDAIRAAMHRERDDRPESCAELAQILWGDPENAEAAVSIPRMAGRDSSMYAKAKGLALATPAPVEPRTDSPLGMTVRSDSLPPPSVSDTEADDDPLSTQTSLETFVGEIVKKPAVPLSFMAAGALGTGLLLLGMGIAVIIMTPEPELDLPTEQVQPVVESPEAKPEAPEATPESKKKSPDSEQTKRPTTKTADVTTDRPKKRRWARVAVDGLTDRVVVKSGTEEFELPGRVPPGTWEIFAWIDGKPTAAGKLTVVVDEEVSLSCSIVDRSCVRK